MKILLQKQNRNYFKKIHYQLFNNHSTELSPSSEIDNIIQDEEGIFKKNPTVGLPEVSRLINATISKRQGDHRMYSFLEKKKCYIKRKMDSLWTPITWWIVLWSNKLINFKKYFFTKYFFLLFICNIYYSIYFINNITICTTFTITDNDVNNTIYKNR